MLTGITVLAVLALAVGTGAVWMTLIQPVPVRWAHVHYRFRKPAAWALLVVVVLWAGLATGWRFSPAILVAVGVTALGVVLAHRLHQETAFPAADFPSVAADPATLPLADDAQVALISHGGITRAYPLDYVIHHHIVNDRFGDRLVALTYCAMCRSVIPFDVTDVGPLTVGSFKNANMIVADRRTATFFQQATSRSIVGPLHPHTLTMIPFQILPWSDVLRLDPVPATVAVTAQDLRRFELPIPGLWRRIVAGEATPGLAASRRDRARPARTRVIGITDPSVRPSTHYLKGDLLRRGTTHDPDIGIVAVASGDTVNCFADGVDGQRLELVQDPPGTLRDRLTGTTWDLVGTHRSGPLEADLVPVAASDEYWFSWRFFHPDSELRELADTAPPGTRSASQRT